MPGSEGPAKGGHFGDFGYIDPKHGAGSPRPAAPIERQVRHGSPWVWSPGNRDSCPLRDFSQAEGEARDPRDFGDKTGGHSTQTPLKPPVHNPHSRCDISMPAGGSEAPVWTNGELLVRSRGTSPAICSRGIAGDVGSHLPPSFWNNAKRQGTLADPVTAAAGRLPRRGESSSMRVWTGPTGAPATPTPSGHHLPPIPDAGPRGPAPNGRTSPPFSRRSSASGRRRFTRAPAGRRTEHPAHPPPPSQGQRPTRCRGDHTPRTRDQGSLRPTQGLRKERGNSLPHSPQTAKPRRAHRNNRGTTRAAQGRTQK